VDPVTFSLLMQLGAAALKGGDQLWNWWLKVHAAAQQELPLDAQQVVDLESLVQSRKSDPNWQADQNV
jgi:hypothetical protein